MSSTMNAADTNKSKSYEKRDALVAEETRIREKQSWYGSTPDADTSKPKYFVTFPYPYMNGKLHLGHGFTCIKCDFLARYKRQRGLNVLVPFGFHGTGTPIVACANKVKMELDSGTEFDSLPKNSQLHILYDMGVKVEEFQKFIDPYYWLEYFIKEAKIDLDMLGVSADFKRSFVTTKINPYYDLFIKWQFSILEQKGVLKFGKRNIIFSPQMNQPCAAHDRSTGEEADVQEHTLIKLSLPNEKWYNDTKTFLLAATLRPETMYGQTNIWVHRDSSYSIFKFRDENYIARYETFRNLKHQYPDDSVEIISENYIKGSDLIGLTVVTPYVSNPIPIFHMNSVSSDKGTGIVTSVPTDSPTDYLFWRELVEKNTENLTNTLTGVISVNDDTTYAKTCIESKNVKIGQNAKLEEVHDHVYKMEHQSGTLVTGKYAGETLKDAHKKIQADLINESLAILYNEPSEQVISRVGDVCVVAKTDQWYIDYGNEYFTTVVNDHIDTTLNMNDDIAQNLIKDGSNWIKEWPCSRHVGLGTLLPVDERFVIDSLSDSTIYMAYYTISHLIDQIPLELVSNEFWSHIFLSNEMPQNLVNTEYAPIVSEMHKGFNYWYPLDMRISGKDLIKNHLTMALYNHAMIWDNPKMYPQSYSVNGYLVLNKTKMSKSTGNFMTLRDGIDKFGADATRVALAIAGDGMDDANFDETNAQEATLLLTTEKDWIQQICNQPITESEASETFCDNIWDKIFRNEVNATILEITNELESLNFRKGFVGIYKMLNARDKYRNIYVKSNLGLSVKYHIECISFIEKLLAIMAPFCPFWAESIYDNITGHAMKKTWPNVSNIDYRYLALYDSFNTISSQISKKYAQVIKKSSKDNKFKLDIKVHTKRDSTELIIMNKFSGMTNMKDIRNEFDRLMAVAEKRDRGTIAQVSKTVMNNISRYGFEWMNWNLAEQLDEYEMLKEWIPIVFKDHSYGDISINKFEGDEYNFIKNGPQGYHTFTIVQIIDQANNASV